jgi:hypothetical protein
MDTRFDDFTPLPALQYASLEAPPGRVFYAVLLPLYWTVGMAVLWALVWNRGDMGITAVVVGAVGMWLVSLLQSFGWPGNGVGFVIAHIVGGIPLFVDVGLLMDFLHIHHRYWWVLPLITPISWILWWGFPTIERWAIGVAMLIVAIQVISALLCLIYGIRAGYRMYPRRQARRAITGAGR